MSAATDRMVELVENPAIEHVFIEFADVNGISRSKQLTADTFLDKWEDGFSMNLVVLAQTPRNHVPEGSGLGVETGHGDGVVHPIPETVTRLPWRENAVRVLCAYYHEGERLACSPRAVLESVLSANDFEFDFYSGSELEFYLLEEGPDGNYVPATDGSFECVSWATEEISDFYDQLVEWASDYGIDLTAIHHEHGPGQFEVLFDYGRPLEQAETTFDFKRLVKQVGRSFDQWPTFMAKPFADQSGSGYHIHVSAFDDRENVFEADAGGTLSERGRHFVGGLMEHADSLVALGTPNINGFKRFEPNSFVPYTASWGYDNRMTAVRVPPGDARLEGRIASADANPYLVIAGTIAAGLDGLRRELEPTAPIENDPTGDRPELSRSPELALRALETDDALVELLGEDFVRMFTASKRCELQAFRDHVTDWERDQYVKTI
ncbi:MULTISPECIES: glutamine synthetase family protein [unclassified Halorubrum]|uniref:glutamine synthetase family protein n=1 Tax=unclassified Halorubrum TaxID=2642239 RepID=UPI000BCD44FE|nr:MULTISPECIES: glutamine synthetase family protein [unclassified Halorubrum]OYR38540.1 glutamate--ammonia ligase [Halorubrum sp. Hd13]OYR46351.1 glutamate--ammonia ligase [Halorubrum sp. Ea8]